MEAPKEMEIKMGPFLFRAWQSVPCPKCPWKAVYKYHLRNQSCNQTADLDANICIFRHNGQYRYYAIWKGPLDNRCFKLGEFYNSVEESIIGRTRAFERYLRRLAKLLMSYYDC